MGAERPTAGPASLVQGVYGARGNLELVACDRADGLWVFWFNSDLGSDPLETPDVPPGAWSAGLRFALGHRYLEAQILQSTLGPDHLEVLALDAEGALQSWYWSPEHGFRRRGGDAARGVTAFRAEHDGGTLAVTVLTRAADGRPAAARHLVSGPDGYPDRAWRIAADGPALSSDEAAREAIVACGVPAADIAGGTARAVRSDRGGGTTELVWRDASGILHHRGLR